MSLLIPYIFFVKIIKIYYSSWRT